MRSASNQLVKRAAFDQMRNVWPNALCIWPNAQRV